MKCSVENCDNEDNYGYKGGLCSTHYRKNKSEVNKKNGIICYFEGCNEGVSVMKYGLCSKHHTLTVESRSTTKCTTIDCDRNVYAKGLCRKHRALALRTKKYNLRAKNCEFPNCKLVFHIEQNSQKQYCAKHRKIVARNIKYGLNIYDPQPRPGIHWADPTQNANWKGGDRGYFKKHGLFKRIRRNKLNMNPNCEKCNEEARLVHHKDGNQNNHALDNLESLCYMCHRQEHKTSHVAYKKIYGSTRKALALRLNLSIHQVTDAHKNQTLGMFLAEDKIKTLHFSVE